MTVFSGTEVKDYVPLENLEVELWKGVDAEEAEGRFALCFWIYIDNCVSFPSSILVQVLFSHTRPSSLLCGLMDSNASAFFVFVFFLLFSVSDVYKGEIGLVAESRKFKSLRRLLSPFLCIGEILVVWVIPFS